MGKQTNCAKTDFFVFRDPLTSSRILIVIVIIGRNTCWFISKHTGMKIDFHTHKNEFSL